LLPTPFILEDRRLLATFTVTSPLDTLTAGAPTQGTLRWAIARSNATPGANTIDFDATVFATTQTITLSQGQLVITSASGLQTITGPQAGVKVSGGSASRVFEVSAASSASFSSLIVTGGNVDAPGGAGLLNLGVTSLTGCTFASNSAGGVGGGLENGADATLSLTDCTLSGNSAARGGGVYNDVGATLTLTTCTLNGNSAALGGGIFISDSSSLNLTASTLNGNLAGAGGGIENGGTATVNGTIVAGNTTGTAPSDIDSASVVSGSYDLVGAGGAGGLLAANHNQIGITNLSLGPLGAYGGPAQTMPLLPGSPAVHTGTLASGPATDERGLPLDSPPDIGAFQSQTGSLVVNTIGDGVGSPLGDVTLRQAVNLANALDGGQSIGFDPTAFGGSQIITLGLGVLDLKGTVGTITITGPQSGVTVTVPASDTFQNPSGIFQVEPSVTASFSELNLIGGIVNGPGGAGLLNFGTVSLTGCTIGGNRAQGDGAGVLNDGVDAVLTLDNCTINGNSATGEGGGLLNQGSATLTDCTIGGNTAGGDGGGALNGGSNATLSLTWCAISGNSAASSGGLDNDGTARLIDSTVSGNTATAGGGLVNAGTMTLISCTVSGNASSTVNAGGLEAEGDATLTDTIVAGNSTAGLPGDLGGQGNITGSYNLIGTGGLAGGSQNLLNVSDPGLGPLGAYGGPTPTEPLLPGSPAIDAGTSGSGAPGTDQRGQGRVGAPDIGAFESQQFMLAVTVGSTPQSAELGTAFTNPVGVIVTAKNPIEPVAGGTVRFVVSPSAGGASATLDPPGTATIDDQGEASITATANQVLGQYTVAASSSGASPAVVTFNLSNVLQPVFSGLASPTITYGTPSVNLSGTILAGGTIVPPGSVDITFNGLKVTAAIEPNGSFTANFATGSLDVHESPYQITYSYTANGNFQGAMAQTHLTVNPATPPVIWPSPSPITYGTELSSTQLDATSTVVGSFVYSPDSGTVLHAGLGQTLSVTFTPFNTDDYTTVDANTTIDVMPATPILTWPKPDSITYGTPLSAQQLDAAASWTVAFTPTNVPGTYVYTPAGGAYLLVGNNQPLSVRFTPLNQVDYTAANGMTTIDVARATPVITWSKPAAIVYGTALSAAQLDATASVPGTFKYAPAAGTILHAGNGRSLSAIFTPSDTADDTTAIAGTTIDILPAVPVITWPKPAGIVYGTVLGDLQLDATANVPGTFTYMPAAGTVLHTGTGQALSVRFVPADATDYGTTVAMASLDVRPATTTTQISLSADQSVYGQPVIFTATVKNGGPGTSVPVSSVTFFDGTTALGTANVAGSGQAVLMVSGLSAAVHSITALCGGDTDFLPSPSGYASLVVAADPTHVVFVPRLVRKSRRGGVAVNMTASIEPAAPGGGVPTGTVTYLNKKKKVLGMVRLQGGTAALSIKENKVLNKAVTVVYSGDGDFLPSIMSRKVTLKLLKAKAPPLAKAVVTGARVSR
jgi:hypothetical protein